MKLLPSLFLFIVLFCNNINAQIKNTLEDFDVSEIKSKSNKFYDDDQIIFNNGFFIDGLIQYSSLLYSNYPFFYQGGPASLGSVINGTLETGEIIDGAFMLFEEKQI
jgi:hypothetical protein